MRRIKVRDIVSVTDKTFKEKIKAIENKTTEENNYRFPNNKIYYEKARNYLDLRLHLILRNSNLGIDFHVMKNTKDIHISR